MNKVYKVFIVLLLTVGSFFYTNKVVEFIRDSDPIMKKIKTKEVSIQKPIDAKITNDRITPGIYGKSINYNESFKKMKKYGKYNSELTVFKEVSPTVTIDDYYDKYISEGNSVNNAVSLVFTVNTTDNIDEIISVLDEYNVTATFFLDGLWLENNINRAISMKDKHELEILNYNSRYEELYFTSSIKLISDITGKAAKYCYATYDQKEVLELCSKLKLHTIIPTITTGNYPYGVIKTKLRNASIIGMPVNSSTKIELSTIISYIKQRGYNLVNLETLLSEDIDSK